MDFPSLGSDLLRCASEAFAVYCDAAYFFCGMTGVAMSNSANKLQQNMEEALKSMRRIAGDVSLDPALEPDLSREAGPTFHEKPGIATVIATLDASNPPQPHRDRSNLGISSLPRSSSPLLPPRRAPRSSRMQKTSDESVAKSNSTPTSLESLSQRIDALRGSHSNFGPVLARPALARTDLANEGQAGKSSEESRVNGATSGVPKVVSPPVGASDVPRTMAPCKDMRFIKLGQGLPQTSRSPVAHMPGVASTESMKAFGPNIQAHTAQTHTALTLTALTHSGQMVFSPARMVFAPHVTPPAKHNGGVAGNVIDAATAKLLAPLLRQWLEDHVPRLIKKSSL